MSDEATTETTEEVKDKDVPKQLREALKRSNEENAKLRETVMSSAYAELGLDTQVGLGKAVSQVYEGETSLEALTKFVRDEYSYEAPVVPDNPETAGILAGQAQLDTASEGAGSVTPPTQQDQLAKAEAEGDYQTAMAIKSRTIEGWFQDSPE